jgi:hypothetical protein
MKLFSRWLCVGAITLCAGLWIVLYLAGCRIAQENGWMENQQALCLAGATLTFAIVSRRQTFPPEKLFCLSLALFCFTFLLREFELPGGRFPDWARSLLTGKLRRVWLAGLWLALLMIARREVREIFQVFVSWLRTPSGWVMILGGVFYGATWPLDKYLLDLPKPLNMFLEELGDSIATLLILQSSLWAGRAINARPPPPAQEA